jgi:hypothetical protein
MNSSEQPKTSIEPTESARTGKIASHSSLVVPAVESSRFSPRSSIGPMRAVEFHIEELVLHGFNPVNRFRIGEAVERELTRLITERDADDAIAQRGEIALIDGVVFEVQPDSSSKAIGIQLARAIYGGLNR